MQLPPSCAGRCAYGICRPQGAASHFAVGAIGQTLVVIGESGCGKTVLLKLLIGLLRPTQGHVTFDGLALTIWANAN